MKRSNAIIKFASLLEKHLPPIEEVHSFARKAGFTAWYAFVEERLKLIDESKRPAELRTLLLCCREEFCNFTLYSRNIGGDGLTLPELERLRRTAKAATDFREGYVLESDAVMRADLARSGKRYAQAINERAAGQFAAERDRYVASVHSIVDSGTGESIADLAPVLLQTRFGEAGFSMQSSRPGSACFKKVLGNSALVFACLDDIPRLGSIGWRGQVRLSFFVRAGGGLEESYQATCCLGAAGLPLRIAGLAPGLEAYTNGAYLLPSNIQATEASEVITLTVYEAAPNSAQGLALVLGQLGMAVDCNLTFFRAVENSLAAACAELAGSA